MRVILAFVLSLGLIFSATLAAQGRPASPTARAATEVAGEWDTSGQRPRYSGGKWIEIVYSAPILRQRDNIFGEGESYGKQVLAGAPVWRAGANQSTRLVTEASLEIGGKTVAAGEYSLFIDLKGADDWELIVSSYGAAENFRERDADHLWGAYDYTDARDVARVKMEVASIDGGPVDQLGWGFSNVSKSAGTLCVWWATSVGCAPFAVSE